MTLVIYGPTATGKTNLAISFAKKLNGELISADSRQVYKNLDIGSGKVSFDSKIERHNNYWIVDGIKINGFDLVDPGQPFSVADFVKFANTAIGRITKEKKVPIIVGGTGFYIKALVSGLDTFGIPKNPKLRNELEQLSRLEIYTILQKLDPDKANSMNRSDRHNPHRIIRAIEVTKAGVKTTRLEPITNYRIIGLTAPNQFLFKKVDDWLELRLKNGLVEEVKSQIENGTDPFWLESLGLEYRWITQLVLGKIDKNRAVAGLKGDIHSFVRRQKTWFSKFQGIEIFNITNNNWQDRLSRIRLPIGQG